MSQLTANPIIDKILNDANKFVDTTIVTAKNEATDILNTAKSNVQKEGEKILANAKVEQKNASDRMIAAKKLAAKKEILEAKQALIENVINSSLNKINNLNIDEYLKIIKNMIINAINETKSYSDNFEIIAPLDSKISNEFIEEIKNEIKITNLVLSNNKADIKNGFVLKANNIEINCTFEAVMRSNREQLEQEISKILF